MYEVRYGMPDSFTVLSTHKTLEQAEEFMYNSIRQYFPFSHYIRSWEDPEHGRIYDFGSHTRFYFIKVVE